MWGVGCVIVAVLLLFVAVLFFFHPPSVDGHGNVIRLSSEAIAKVSARGPWEFSVIVSRMV